MQPFEGLHLDLFYTCNNLFLCFWMYMFIYQTVNTVS